VPDMDGGEGNPCANCGKNHHLPPTPVKHSAAQHIPALPSLRTVSINLTQALWTLTRFVVELDTSADAELHQSPAQAKQLDSLAPHHPAVEQGALHAPP